MKKINRLTACTPCRPAKHIMIGKCDDCQHKLGLLHIGDCKCLCHKPVDKYESD